MANNKYTLEIQKNVLKLYKNNKSASQIARETGISLATVYNWGKKWGIKKTKQRFVSQKINNNYQQNIFLQKVFGEQTQALDLSLATNKKQVKNDFDILEEDIFRPSTITIKSDFNNIINDSKNKIINSQEIIMLNDDSDLELLVIDENYREINALSSWQEVKFKQNISKIEKFLDINLQEGITKIVI